MEIVSSRKNANVRFIRSFLREKNMRDEHGVFAVEGNHLCGELVRAEFNVTFAAYTEKAAAKYPETLKKLVEAVGSSICITEELAEYISDTKSPQGLFAVAEIPGWRNQAKPALSKKANIMIVLDGVQDPGNVGTIIRTAEALGANGIVLLEGCADVWSPKTLRASMGSAFRLPVINAAASELQQLLPEYTVYGAMLDETAKRLGEVKFPEKTAIVIGSEGSGISPEVAALCGEKIYIPIKGAESLNAATAAAIIMWELVRP